MSEDDKKWYSMPLTELRSVAKKYKQFHSLGNISKAKKEDLIMTLKKFMMFDGNDIKQKPNATPIATKGTMEAPAPKAKKPKAPAPPPAPAVMGDKGYKKKVKKVKDPKKQMEGASADAKAIAEQMKAYAQASASSAKTKVKYDETEYNRLYATLNEAEKLWVEGDILRYKKTPENKMKIIKNIIGMKIKDNAEALKTAKGFLARVKKEIEEGKFDADKGIFSRKKEKKEAPKEAPKQAPKPKTPPAPKPAPAPKQAPKPKTPPKPKAPTPPPPQPKMTAEEEEAELVAYRKKKADQKAKEEAKKAKASKPASMPKKTDSGASASSAPAPAPAPAPASASSALPASDFLPDPYDTELKKGGDVPERLYEWYKKNILNNPRKDDVLDMTSEDYDKLWNGYISISTLGGYKSTAKRKSKIAKEVESESDAFRQLEKSEEKKWVEEAKNLPFFPYLSAYTLRRVMDETDGQQTLKNQIDKLKDLKKAYGLLISPTIWTKLTTLFSVKN